MTLSALISDYVSFKQAIGMRYRTEVTCFRSFLRTMGDDIELAEIAPLKVEAFLRVRGSVTSVWHLRYTILNGLFRFATERGYLALAPLPRTLPKRPPPQRPHIYTTEELRRLLAAMDSLESRKSPLQAITFRTLFLTLYGTGLRISEALGLRLRDVDLKESLLTVRDTKFFKTRLVPVGPHLAEVLRCYLWKRRDLPCPSGENSAFFVTRTGHSITYGRADEIFCCMRKQAGIARPWPRIHDFRHTYAVHRLEAWYREGADVQRLLPSLATFLGHVGIRETQAYLTMTPELLEEANTRFERYALPKGGVP